MFNKFNAVSPRPAGLAILVALWFSAPIPDASADWINAFYAEDRCLGIQGSLNDDTPKPVIVQQCDRDRLVPQQQWRVKSAFSGYFRISNQVRNGLCLSVGEVHANQGTPVVLAPCGAPNTNDYLLNLWNVTNGDDPIIQLVVRADQCLQKRDRGWTNGNPVHLWDCNADSRISAWQVMADDRQGFRLSGYDRRNARGQQRLLVLTNTFADQPLLVPDQEAIRNFVSGPANPTLVNQLQQMSNGRLSFDQSEIYHVKLDHAETRDNVYTTNLSWT